MRKYNEALAAYKKSLVLFRNMPAVYKKERECDLYAGLIASNIALNNYNEATNLCDILTYIFKRDLSPNTQAYNALSFLTYASYADIYI